MPAPFKLDKIKQKKVYICIVLCYTVQVNEMYENFRQVNNAFSM